MSNEQIGINIDSNVRHETSERSKIPEEMLIRNLSEGVVDLNKLRTDFFTLLDNIEDTENMEDVDNVLFERLEGKLLIVINGEILSYRDIFEQLILSLNTENTRKERIFQILKNGDNLGYRLNLTCENHLIAIFNSHYFSTVDFFRLCVLENSEGMALSKENIDCLLSRILCEGNISDILEFLNNESETIDIFDLDTSLIVWYATINCENSLENIEKVLNLLFNSNNIEDANKYIDDVITTLIEEDYDTIFILELIKKYPFTEKQLNLIIRNKFFNSNYEYLLDLLRNKGEYTSKISNEILNYIISNYLTMPDEENIEALKGIVDLDRESNGILLDDFMRDRISKGTGINIDYLDDHEDE